jgi:hypothetical protein
VIPPRIENYLRSLHERDELLTHLLLILCAVVFVVRALMDSRVIISYYGRQPEGAVLLATWYVVKYLFSQKLYWFLIPPIALSVCVETWVADVINFVVRIFRPIGRIFTPRAATQKASKIIEGAPTPVQNKPATRSGHIPSTLVSPIRAKKAEAAQPRPLPTQMTVDCTPHLPAIYHGYGLAYNRFDAIYEPVKKIPAIPVSGKRVLLKNPKSVEILYQPREYHIIAANYPFDKQDLETRTLTLEGTSYRCVVVTDPKDESVLEWLYQNRACFRGGRSRAVYDGSGQHLPLFGSYVPRTLYLRPHLIKAHLTPAEVVELLERFYIRNRRLDYYALVIDSPGQL